MYNTCCYWKHNLFGDGYSESLHPIFDHFPIPADPQSLLIVIYTSPLPLPGTALW